MDESPNVRIIPGNASPARSDSPTSADNNREPIQVDNRERQQIPAEGNQPAPAVAEAEAHLGANLAAPTIEQNEVHDNSLAVATGLQVPRERADTEESSSTTDSITKLVFSHPVREARFQWPINSRDVQEHKPRPTSDTITNNELRSIIKTEVKLIPDLNTGDSKDPSKVAVILELSVNTKKPRIPLQYNTKIEIILHDSSTSVILHEAKSELHYFGKDKNYLRLLMHLAEQKKVDERKNNNLELIVRSKVYAYETIEPFTEVDES